MFVGSTDQDRALRFERRLPHGRWWSFTAPMSSLGSGTFFRPPSVFVFKAYSFPSSRYNDTPTNVKGHVIHFTIMGRSVSSSILSEDSSTAIPRTTKLPRKVQSMCFITAWCISCGARPVVLLIVCRISRSDRLWKKPLLLHCKARTVCGLWMGHWDKHGSRAAHPVNVLRHRGWWYWQGLTVLVFVH